MHFPTILSMRNRALIALITIVVAVFGVLSMTGLKQELAPSIEFPQLAVMATYPGASPAVVADDVSAPIEAAIQGVPGLESTLATSSSNLSVIAATFTYGTNLATAEQKISQALNRIKSALPDGIEPQVLSGSLDDLPVIQLAVSSDLDPTRLAESLRGSVLDDLKKVDGVRDAQLLGAPERRITITPNQRALAANGLTTQALSAAFTQSGILLPAGNITEDGHTLSVQAGQKLSSIAEVAALPIVGIPGANPVTIGDVADVELSEEAASSISRVNGADALSVAITKLPGANTVDVSKAIREAIPHEESVLGDAQITVVFDQAPYIEESISALTEEGMLGLAFAILVILVFLLSLRTTLITAISIPTSVLITFIAMQAVDYTLNIITLGALTIAIGRVVDDSIVVTENIKRHLALNPDPTRRSSVIIEAVREVAAAITASTATTVAVFLPIAFVGDMTGELFRPFALTITIALAASLVVALTIVPVLAFWFLRGHAVHGRTRHATKQASETLLEASSDEASAKLALTAENAEVSHAENATTSDAASAITSSVAVHNAPAAEPLTRRDRARRSKPDDVAEQPNRLQRGYLPIIRWTLRHGFVTILIAVLVMGGTIALTPLMKTNFLGSSGQNTLQVQQVFDPSTSLAAVDAGTKAVEDSLRANKDLETVQLTIGSSGSALRDAFFGGGSSIANYSLTAKPTADADSLAQQLRDELAKLHTEGKISVSASSGFGMSTDIEVDVRASTDKTLTAATKLVSDAMAKVPEISQVEDSLTTAVPYIAVRVNREAAAEVGLSEMAVSGVVSQAMRPTQLGSVAIDDASHTVYLQTPNPPTTLQALQRLAIPTATGMLPLSELANVEETLGPVTINSIAGLRSATVTLTPGTDNLGAASAAVEQALADLDLPGGASAKVGGVTSSQTEAFAQLGLALLAAILIVYVIMVATFRSLLQPLLLLISVPFAATGALLLQLATGIPLGVASLVGVLMLIGIVVTNAIVLIDLVNQYRERGMKVHDALVLGASRRLRPILMTALATIFALIPMAVGVTGQGGFISQPLALVVIGGLVSSTLLTLIVLPVLYGMVEGALERRRTRRAARGVVSVE